METLIKKIIFPVEWLIAKYRERKLQKRIQELKKRDPFIYK
jgi:hypothetical protein